MDNSAKEIENISRRDFFKMKFLLILYTYFNKFFGLNILVDTKSSNTDYSILDKFLQIPFSTNVKEEIHLRVKLQKKYCYDANGRLHTLNRFLKETINFIISRKNFNDFKLLNSIKDKQIDYSYMLNCTARHNELNSIKFIQKKLLSTNSNMLNEAILYAVKSQSFEVSAHLIQQKIKLDYNTQNIILNEFKKEEFDIFYKKLTNTNNIKLLPSHKKFDIKNIRKVIKKHITPYELSNYDFEQNLYVIVYNSIAEMYLQYIIDDFTVELYQHKVYVKVWNHSNAYTINLFKIFENILRIHGYSGLDEAYLLNGSELEIQNNIEFGFKQNSAIIYKDEVFSNVIDHYKFIDIEIL